MTQPPQNINTINSKASSILGTHRFYHEAMATTFEIIIAADDASYAQQAARAAFDRLDILEQQFSRFISNSDISRINILTSNQPLKLSLEAFEVLLLSRRISAETNGAFDVTIGLLYDCWQAKDKISIALCQEDLTWTRAHTGMNIVKLDEAEHTVQLLTTPVKIDLGGIGKGYAVDQMAKLLRDWSIDTALIHSGGSSVLALEGPAGTNGWPVTISNPENRKQILAYLCLKNRALGGSGLQKGQHIIDPRTGRPASQKCAAWSCAGDAATADALSTAFMVMSPEQIRQYCLAHLDKLAMIMTEKKDKQTPEDRILRYGCWEKHLA